MAKARNAFYAQSGGVTAVINASACGVIETARKHPESISKVYVGLNGILGALNEDLIDTSFEDDQTIAALKYTPGGAFGSCRHKLPCLDKNETEFKRLLEVFKAHDIGYFFYNGGGDSMDTANKVAQYCASVNYPIQCIGIPKTVDNDLPLTDCCPGFGSAAKYVAISTKEAAMDIKSMHATSTKVFIMEVMGRHAGWLAAASGLIKEKHSDAPHVIVFPEIAFNTQSFLFQVSDAVAKYGYCVVVASEGAKYKDGSFLSASTSNKDAFGHTQLGGVAPLLAKLVQDNLGLKHHWAVLDYLQRSARHIASATDLEQAYEVGVSAVNFALENLNSVMPIIKRSDDSTYRWSIGKTDLSKVANVEKKMPKGFISVDGWNITQSCREYLQPLIVGESYPPYENGLPKYVELKNILVEKKLPVRKQPA